MILDLFAGPGGWSEGLRSLGLEDVGLEWDAPACRTRAAAGHRTIRADVSAYPTEPFVGKVEGLIASPPCQDFSLAGKGAGIDGLRGQLVREVPRWVEVLRPRWIACEQVPPVLGIWQAYAHRFRELGYSTWAGILNAADYGVPQTRQRAFLMASLDVAVSPPEPTHCKGGSESMFGTLLPWVSMAEALGWGYDHRSARTLCGDRSPRWLYPDRDGTHGEIVVDTRRDQREGGSTQTFSKSGEQWLLRPGAQERATVRRIDEPGPTVAFGHDMAQWVWERPSTTVCGDPRVAFPGHHDEEHRSFSKDDGAIRITVAEALTPQGFRPDYPVQGTKTKQFEQVGNAVPPPLAAAVVRTLVGMRLERAA